MERLEFLKKAQELARKKLDETSALSDADYEQILEQAEDQDLALHRKAQQLLEEAAFWMEEAVEIIAEGGGQ